MTTKAFLFDLDGTLVDEHGEAISRARARISKDRDAHRVDPFADVADLVRPARRDGWTIVIATSGRSEGINPHLERLGVRALVDAVTTADETDRSKPHPVIFAAALKRVAAACRPGAGRSTRTLA